MHWHRIFRQVVRRGDALATGGLAGEDQAHLLALRDAVDGDWTAPHFLVRAVLGNEDRPDPF
ncbi:hypothetical protein ACH518_06680 [Methylomonas sp. HW2-6]|uniref:hypothetical protein n=1 Tax=Methylomonas sp. HW2-6 TaxID=3376687 RepID=UPI0040429527